VATSSRAWVYGRYALWDCRFESHRGQSLSVLCYQVEVPASGDLTRPECGVSECDLAASIMKRPWPSEAIAPANKEAVLTCINLHIAVLPFKIFLKKSPPPPVSGEDLM